MIMKKTYILAVLLIMISIDIMADNELVLNGVSTYRGNQTTLTVSMNNTASISGVQFDLLLPNGVTIAKDSDGYPMISLSSRTTSKQHGTLEISSPSTGGTRVLCASGSNAVFSGTSGAILTITLDVPGTMAIGDYTVKIQKIILSTDKSVMYAQESATSILTVLNPIVYVTGVSLNKTSTSIVVGSTEILTATVIPTDATNAVLTWSSSDESVATVSGGVVTAVTAGTATITASSTDGSGKSAACIVTIENFYNTEDINKDGNVDTQDVLKIYDYIKADTGGVSGVREDVNNDNLVDTQDVLKIYEYILTH